MTTTLLEDVFNILSVFEAGKETHWKDDYGLEITIEPTKRDRYILRRYYANGNKAWEIRCKQDKRSGTSITWHENGNKAWEMEFAGGEMDGKCVGRDVNGNVICDEEYADGVYRSDK